MMSTSAFSSLALALASNATDAGSAPSLSERTTGTPTLAPQVSSWSAAAARNVSAAPSMTCLPSETSRRESLPAVVVLPVPFTPTMMMTLGLFAPSLSALRRRSTSVPTSFRSLSFNATRTSAGSDWPAMRASLRSSSTSCSLASAPTSASRRVSSTSSQSASESWSLARMLNRALPNGLPDLDRRALRRCMRVPAASGVSTAGVADSVTADPTGVGSVATGDSGVADEVADSAVSLVFSAFSALAAADCAADFSVAKRASAFAFAASVDLSTADLRLLPNHHPPIASNAAITTTTTIAIITFVSMAPA